ncbi:MAG: TRAP transporter large permease subunit [Bacteroidota bacterium]
MEKENSFVAAARRVAKGVDYLIYFTVYPFSILLVATLLIITYDVIARYVFNAPTRWAFDISIYFFIWFSFLTIAYIQSRKRHVQVELFISRFPERTRAIWEIFILIFFLIFSSILLYYTFIYAAESYTSGESGWSVLQIKIWWVKAAMPASFFLLDLILLRHIIHNIYICATTQLDRGYGFYSKAHIVIPLMLAVIICTFIFTIITGIPGIIVFMFILLFMGIPIFPALGLTGIIGFYFIFGGWNSVEALAVPVTFASLDNFALVCLPLFVLAGQLLQSSGVGEELYDFISKWTSWMPNGEAVATIGACAVFAAVSTSSVATLVTIGLIALPALKYYKYDDRHSYGLLAAGGTLGLMIPPSGAMIIYAAVTEESLGKLFLAGLFPGIILALLFIAYSMIHTYYLTVRSGIRREKRVTTWEERIVSLKKAVWGILAPVIILGGIYSGIFTPLESGAIAAMYVIIMVLVRRKVSIFKLPEAIGESSLSSVMVLSIIIGALIFGDFITLIRAPNILITEISAWQIDRFYVLLTLLGVYLILGLFLEVVSCMLITLPIVYPLVTVGLGYDGIWFAVILTLTMEMAVITPPVGLNLYGLMGISNAQLGEILKGVLPFFIIMLLALAIFIAFPSLSLWLPTVAIGG